MLVRLGISTRLQGAVGGTHKINTQNQQSNEHCQKLIKLVVRNVSWPAHTVKDTHELSLGTRDRTAADDQGRNCSSSDPVLLRIEAPIT